MSERRKRPLQVWAHGIPSYQDSFDELACPALLIVVGCERIVHHWLVLAGLIEAEPDGGPVVAAVKNAWLSDTQSSG